MSGDCVICVWIKFVLMMFVNDNVIKIIRYVMINDMILFVILFICLIIGSYVMLCEIWFNNWIIDYFNEINMKKVIRLMINVVVIEVLIKCKFVNRLLIIVFNGW